MEGGREGRRVNTPSGYQKHSLVIEKALFCPLILLAPFNESCDSKKQLFFFLD